MKNERMDTKSKAKERLVIWMMIICDMGVGNDNIQNFRKKEIEEKGLKHDHNGCDQHKDGWNLNIYI